MEVRIYDYVDHEVPMLLRMFESGYRPTAQSATRVARRRSDPSSHPRTIEYDEEAFRHFEEDL